MSAAKPIASFDEPKLEALVEIMFHAATSDGEFSDVERTEFKKNVESLTDNRLEGAALDALLEKVEKLVAAEPREERLAALKTALGSAHLCLIALELAIKVVAADGILRTSERELLFDIAEGLHIDRDKAADLVVAVTNG
jgi:uncharacterized tellurite resistance protein B-like protein